MKPAAALGFLAAYNVIQNALLNKRGYVAGNLIATGVGLAWARTSGLELGDSGMSRTKMTAGLSLGLGVTAAASGLALLARDHEKVRATLVDERLDDLSEGERRFRMLVRFPLGTALFEEVWFRGLLPAALRQHGARQPELLAATAFAAWHLIPTASAIGAHPEGLSLSAWKRAALVVGGSAAAGIAGLGFTTMRRVSGSLVAPWLAHAAINGLTFWVATSRRNQPPARP